MKRSILLLSFLFVNFTTGQTEFQSFISQVESPNNPGEKAAIVNSFMNYESNQDTPYIEGDTANFIYQDVDDIPVFILSINFPNPFNGSTQFIWAIPYRGHVKIQVFDALGKEVRTLVNSVKTAGRYMTSFSSESLSSGIYFYSMQYAGHIKTKKMIYLR